METKTLTLTEFLLARIAEDEAGAARYGTARAIAEVEAKRRIVEDARAIEGTRGFGIESLEAHVALASRVLVHLATPYADHPDFRDEWRA